MILERVNAGRDIPNDLNVIIEIPANADPVKYEVDKETGALFVDRIMNVAMHYPANYGYIPDTLCEDGDPLDALVVTPFPLVSGCVVRCRPIGLLKMSDEKGGDAKLIAVPIKKMCAMYDSVARTDDLPQMLLRQISHFFEHYKDLDAGKWVKLDGWGSYDDAIAEIHSSVERYEATASS
jgi:inorganic pyrophosphatase